MDAATRNTIATGIARLLGRAPGRVTPIGRGRNNIVVAFRHGRLRFVAKHYFTHARDPRDRLATEFGILTFLNTHRVPNIPRAIARDARTHLAIYEFEPGKPLARGRIASADCRQLADLLTAMADLRDAPGARALLPASEAAFSLDQAADHVRRRLARATPTHPGAADLIRTRLAPAFDRYGTWRTNVCARLRLDPHRTLPRARRTLSPADHGFHNALRRPDGSLVFLDFEYAGWDDPAVMIAKACLQPDIPIPAAERVSFVRTLFAHFPDDPALPARFVVLYPLLALHWSLIMLNPLMPVSAERRRFAQPGRPAAPAAVLRRAASQAREAEDLLNMPNDVMRAALESDE